LEKKQRRNATEEKINGVEIWYATDTMLKDNLKLHGSTNQACNVQDEEGKSETEKLFVISLIITVLQ
jgi:hypothetical protein